MEYLTNWTDLNIISENGWSGSKAFTDGNLVFTATNGWHTLGWNLPNTINKHIIIEFDYKYTNIENWGNTPWILNDTGPTYGLSIYNLTNQDKWVHAYCDITSSKGFIGINVRGADNTGKSVTMLLNNVRIYDATDVVIDLKSSGVQKADNFVERLSDNVTWNKNSILANNFYEI